MPPLDSSAYMKWCYAKYSLNGLARKKKTMKNSDLRMDWPNMDELEDAPKKIKLDLPNMFPVKAEEKDSASITLIRKAKELSDQGKSLPLIANEMGKDQDWVHASLLIAEKLPETVHKAIAASKFSRTAALQLLLANQEKLSEIVDGALKIADVEGKL